MTGILGDFSLFLEIYINDTSSDFDQQSDSYSKDKQQLPFSQYGSVAEEDFERLRNGQDLQMAVVEQSANNIL